MYNSKSNIAFFVLCGASFEKYDISAGIKCRITSFQGKSDNIIPSIVFKYIAEYHRNGEKIMQYNGSRLRHEQKYIINYQEYAYLKARLSGIMRYDPHCGDNGYHIRSLYFDDIYNTAMGEKESGVQFRQKYRIRIYEKSADIIKLERKDKYGEFIAKESYCINPDEFYRICEGDDISFLLQSGRPMPSQMFWAIRTLLLKPAVIVDYQRDVFICNEGNVRITFDRDLQAGVDNSDIFGSVHVVNALEPGTMVLEIKYDDYLPDYIKKALQISSHRREAVSKYVYCRITGQKQNPAGMMLLSKSAI